MLGTRPPELGGPRLSGRQPKVEQVRDTALSEEVVWRPIRPTRGPSALPESRTSAKPCRAAGEELEQIQMLLGRASLGSSQDRRRSCAEGSKSGRRQFSSRETSGRLRVNCSAAGDALMAHQCQEKRFHAGSSDITVRNFLETLKSLLES